MGFRAFGFGLWVEVQEQGLSVLGSGGKEAQELHERLAGIEVSAKRLVLS